LAEKNLTIDRGFYSVHIGHHFRILVDIVPDGFIVRMENVRTVNMYHDISLRIASVIRISADMVSLVDNFNLVTLFSKLTGNDHA
jgi:hypothetical protein